MSNLFQEVNETPELPDPDIEVVEHIRELFADPDTSGMFTVQMIVEELGITRGQARGRLQEKLDSGEVELSLEWKGTNYYRRVGKTLDNEG